tara:strand:+ start:393 stop:1580 length:1188 start_codon:yes stop_codon:yes gene_type:complete
VSQTPDHFDAIIVGAGGAGLMCARTAGLRGRSVLLLEHNDRIGKKILISGGGRCNFTNLNASPENYLSNNPHFCRSALSRYPASEFIDLVQQHGIEFYEKTLGQLFCRTSSREIVDLLRSECRAAGVHLKTDCAIHKIEHQDRFHLQTSHGAVSTKSLVVATGALSFPQLGATDFGYRVAEQFDVPIIEPRPGLAPIVPQLTNGRAWPFGELSGISLDCIATAGGQSFRENLLFTHSGLSGPAILQVSNYCPVGETFTLNLLPDRDPNALLEEASTQRLDAVRWLGPWLPNRVAAAFAKAFATDKPLGQMKQSEREQLVQSLCAWPLMAADTGGYGKAEVTVGGVDTEALSSKTMECRTVPGLYFIGEVVDVTGWLGGYNFQWAWASGHAAGEVI